MEQHLLVMGGTSGIGRAVALRARGRVSIVGRSEERGREVERTRGDGTRFIAADLREPGAAERVVEEAVRAHGPIDAAVNAAAGLVLEGPRRLHELDDAAFEREIVAELRLCFESMRAELAARRAGHALSIVNVSSINGLGAAPFAPFYSAVKAAQLALTKSAALDYAADGVRVNAVVLGAFDTPMLERAHDLLSGGNAAVARERFTAMVPLHRIGRPEEAAAVIEWLCREESSYVTGASWIVDGGLTAFAR